MPYLEIEKKYLVTELPQFVTNHDYDVIEQTYFSRPYDFGDIRVRNKNGEKILTFKSFVKHGIKNEYEINIPEKEYQSLLSKTPSNIIKKHRYKVPYTMDNTIIMEIDVFQGDLEGLVIAEIELETEDDFCSFIPEDWFNEEITGQNEYSNNSLSVYGKPKKLTLIEKIKKLFKLWKNM